MEEEGIILERNKETKKKGGASISLCLLFFFSECQSSDGNLGKANQCGYKQWSVSVEQLLSFRLLQKIADCTILVS